MTGAELLAHVREGLRTWGTDWYGPNPNYRPLAKQAAAALTALDGCVLLTADEAKKVRLVFGPLVTEYWSEGQEALALLGGERQ